MRDATPILLRRALEGDGVLRVPLAQADDATLLFLIQHGLVTPLPFADPAGLEIWYEVGMRAFLEARDTWAALHSSHR